MCRLRPGVRVLVLPTPLNPNPHTLRHTLTHTYSHTLRTMHLTLPPYYPLLLAATCSNHGTRQMMHAAA